MFKLTVDGQSVLLRALKQIEHEVSDWRPAWAECEQLFYLIEARQFGSEGGRGGDRWQALSAAYKAWKEVHYPGKPILVREGDLKASLTGKDNKYSIREVLPMSLTLGSAHPAATAHQRGAGRLPRRSPLIITNSDMGQFTRRMLKRMQTVGSQAGFQTATQGGL